ncbi:hypothetical protein MLD38_030454 [Melastoma candidum]|uniref:Uncharacterized protein n=1 Tax=Melastoma candidum TaxID=119954 RepID=A0ACB9MMA4_9MYRT|nr:hypothetical protein MLD38_030454 [Melastoma candidum]
MWSTGDVSRRSVDVPRGCMAVIVGAEGEQRQRFVIPVAYLRHRLFIELLKVSEEEYGFEHKGPITIPCPVSEFRRVQDSINRGGIEGGGSGNHRNPARCFRGR